ncbi:hypothetical protein Lal_00027624 [Lupinus albus]|nr:hypothetical protein Lal_00027624 [Lupinus albus]
MEETSNTAILARLAALEASIDARLENAMAGLVEKLNNITLPNNQFPQQLPLHGSQPRPPATMHDQGLNSDIARELAIQQPFSVTHTIGLAKLVESKITATKSNDWPSTRPAMNVPTNQTVGTTENPAQSSNQNTLSIKRLTAAQMQARKAQELCYNCDEKYIIGHRCKLQQFLLLQIEDPNDTYHNNKHISAV